jgi:hypothetical protein
MMNVTRTRVLIVAGTLCLFAGVAFAVSRNTRGSESSVRSASASNERQGDVAVGESPIGPTDPDLGNSSSALSSRAAEMSRPDYPSKVSSAAAALERVRAEAVDSNEQARAEREAILASPEADLDVVVADEAAKYRPKVLPGVVLPARTDNDGWKRLFENDTLEFGPGSRHPLIGAVARRGLGTRGEWRSVATSAQLVGGSESTSCTVGGIVQTRGDGGGAEGSDVSLELAIMDGSYVKDLEQGAVGAAGFLHFVRREAGGQSLVMSNDKGETYTVKCSPGTLEVFGPKGELLTTMHAVARGLPTPEQMKAAGLPPIPAAQLSEAQSAILSQYPDPTSVLPATSSK